MLSLTCLACLAWLTSCARDESSLAIDPPRDPEREETQKKIEDLLRSPELTLSTPREYYLGAGDVLTITLLGRPDILGSTRDSSQGAREGLTLTLTENPMITLPLVGAVKVHGKTADQIQRELTVAYARFMKDPLLIVTIDKYYRNQVSVLGAVNTPGRFQWDYGDTILDSLFKAGGLSFSSRTGLPPGRYLKIYREKVTQKERNDLPLTELLARLKENDRIAPRREIVVPIEEFILSGNLAYNIPTMPGDVIYIPTAGAVMVEGRVRSPGVTFLGPSLHTLTQVITERGGLRYGADSDVELIRTLPDGTQSSYYLDVRDMLDRDIEDFLLKDGDQIFVYTNPGRVPVEWLVSVFSATASTGVAATYNPVPK